MLTGNGRDIVSIHPRTETACLTPHKNRRTVIVKPNGDKCKPETKPGPDGSAKPESKDHLKSLPMPDLEKKLGSTPDGLSQAEAEKRLRQYGPNEIAEKKTNVIL